ncbi:inorganic phosphate transporter [Amanita muscaria]
MATLEKRTSEGYADEVNKAPVVAAYSLDERRMAALAEVDNAKFSRFHFKVCMVAGVGFFTDSYDIFAINIASIMLGYVYAGSAGLSPSQDLGVKVATPVGTLVGQLLFGWLADRLGRKRMYGFELMIMIVATFAQALSGNADAVNIIGALVVWRFIMGVGVGGDYPLSAVISSEFSSTHIRGRLITAVFAFQGWGNFASSLVSLILVTAYKSQLLSETTAKPIAIDYMWRLLIGLGCVPAVVALYFRLTIPETPRFTMDIERNIDQATADIIGALRHQDVDYDPDNIRRVAAPKASWSDFSQHFRKWENFKLLFGAAYSWFALDISYFGLGLNSAIILSAVGFGSPDPKVTGTFKYYQNLYNVSVGNLILSVAGLIPGYWASFLVIDSWGRRPIQLMGFSILTAIFTVMGFGYNAMIATPAGTKVFIFLYCLANFFQNFGPNVTTFVIPGEAFPTRYRSTGHGICAASGKLGAIVIQVVFAQLKNIGGTNAFLPHILEIFAFFMITGVCSTLLLPETKGKSLEELSNENQDGFVQGYAHNSTNQRA